MPRTFLLLLGTQIVVTVGLFGSDAIQTTGTSGSPSATTTIPGNQPLPARHDVRGSDPGSGSEIIHAIRSLTYRRTH